MRGVVVIGEVPDWLAVQVGVHDALAAGEVHTVLVCADDERIAFDRIAQTRSAHPTARVRPVANPSSAAALAILVASGEDDLLPHYSDLAVELTIPAVRSFVMDTAWEGANWRRGSRAVLSEILRRTGFSVSVGELASLLGRSERTVRRSMESAHVGSPRDIIMRGRFTIARLLRARGLPVSAFSAALGYSSSSALRAGFKTRIGRSIATPAGKGVRVASFS